jgi:hypothetical protein
MSQVAKIYMRRNGSFGSSYRGVEDTGHCIHEDSGKFTVWSIDGSGHRIADGVSRDEAESAISKDWDAAP